MYSNIYINKKRTNYLTGFYPPKTSYEVILENILQAFSFAEFSVQIVCVWLPEVLSRVKMTRWFFFCFLFLRKAKELFRFLCLPKLHLLAGNQFNFDKLTSYFKTDAVLAVMQCSSGMGVIKNSTSGIFSFWGLQSEQVNTIKSNLAMCPGSLLNNI